MLTVSDVAQLVGGTTGGTAIVFFLLWLTGLIHTKAEMSYKDEQIKELKQALASERARSDNLLQTGSLVREVVTGLREELTRLCGSPGGER